MKLGLVLDGGGGKGAYQIGVWKAMREFGLDKQVKAIAGTSVGGLNAALFVLGEFDLAYRIWTEEINSIRVTRLQSDLEKLIEKNIDFQAIMSSPIDCYLAAHCTGQHGEYCVMNNVRNIPEKLINGNMTYYNLRALSQEDCRSLFQTCSTPKAVMLATSAMPVLCKRVFVDGRGHLDGGLGDNSPVYPLAFGSDCDTLLTIHLSHYKVIDKKQFPNVSVLEIVPRVDSRELTFLNGTLNFDPAHAERLIDAGYRDSCAVFQSFWQNHKTASSEEQAARTREELEAERMQRPSELRQYYERILGEADTVKIAKKED